jgi:DNA repair protein RadA/Sms
VVEELAANGRRSSSKAAPAAVRVVALADHDSAAAERVPTGVEEVDRVLGGGLVRGSVVLLAGEPGVGKSTLTLQLASSIAAREEVLLVCGEESPQQVRARAARVGPVRPRIATIADPSIDSVLSAASATSGTVIVDSIQTVFDPEIPSAPGSVSQVRECGARLARLARDDGITIVLVGHVTKDGAVAGPRVLEHLVDVVLTFEGDRQAGIRILRPLKNRFGSTHEAGFFEMSQDGLVAIRDASAYLLADRSPGAPGSVLAACVEGRRPFILEMQALVVPNHGAPPRRIAQGVDAARLSVIVAVIESHLGIGMRDKDVFVSAVGGIRAFEPAADLPIALAILSSLRKTPLPEELVAFGEIGLAGEARRVAASDRRLVEAAGVGCRRAAVPASLVSEVIGIELSGVRHLRDAQDIIRTAKPGRG